MRRAVPVEFAYQAFALIVSIIVVHAFYVALVRPQADAVLEERAARMQTDPSYVAKRNFYVVIRDYEQEACFVMMLWALAIVGYKGLAVARENRLLQMELVPASEGVRILPEDTRAFSRRIQALPEATQRMLLPRALLTGLHRFGATRNVQDVSQAAHTVCAAEAERLESELSMVRYIAWAIPSVGFIGTVRGIGEALTQAHKAVEGDIAGVTQSLGVAFNSTFIALLLTIVLMFIVHQLQLNQERLVLDTERYCDDRLIRRLQVH